MPRTNKKTRIKGLPPKLQLDARDSATGSIPTRARISSDNRTGVFDVSFNDTRAANFVPFFAPLNDLGVWVPLNSGAKDEVRRVNDLLFFVSGFTPKVGLNANRWDDLTFEFRGLNGPSFPLFDDRIPFEGTDGYVNITAADFFPPDNITMVQDTGPSDPFDAPHTIATLISGSVKPFSISLWLSHFSNPLRTVLASAEPGGAFWSGSQLAGCQWAATLESGKLGLRFVDSTQTTVTSESGAGFIGTSVGRVGGWVSSEVIPPAPFTTTASYRHVCITCDGDLSDDSQNEPDEHVKFYLDGRQLTGSVSVFTGSFGTVLGHLPMNLSIGALGDNRGTFGNSSSTIADAFIDEFMIFQKELSFAEVSALKNLRHAPTGTQNGQLGNELAGMFYGTSFETSERFYDFESEQTTALFGDGLVRKGVADGVIDLKTGAPGQNFSPFRDFGNPAVDALEKGRNDPFWATGSNPSVVSTGFSQPVWAKTKIEIDLTPNVDHEVHIQNFLSSSNSHPMAYWNKTTKQWEGIGNGREFDSYDWQLDIQPGNLVPTSAIDGPLEEMTIGFSTILDTGGLESKKIDNTVNCRPFSGFGFPHHPKFSGSSDHFIEMSQFINEPFLLEKVVLYFSGTLRTYNYRSTFSRRCITTFFILNERNFSVGSPTTPFEYYIATGNTTEERRTKITSSNQSSISRDLVTYLQLSMTTSNGFHSSVSRSFWDGLRRELVYENFSFNNAGADPDIQFTGQFAVSGVCKSPIFYFEGQSIQFERSGATGNQYAPPEVIQSWRYNGRNATNDFGRNLINAFESPEVVGEDFNGIGFSMDDRRGTGILPSIPVNEQYDKPNPYLLFPTDKLIFGCQLPLALSTAQNRANNGAGVINPTYDGIGPTLSWSQGGIHKIVLYGSRIREGEESHDTLNQLLATNAIHEVIGE